MVQSVRFTLSLSEGSKPLNVSENVYYLLRVPGFYFPYMC